MGIDLCRSTDDYSDTISVSYGINHSCPPDRFIIARPSLEVHKGADDETRLRFYLRGKSRTMYEFDVHNIPAHAVFHPFWQYHLHKDFARLPTNRLDPISGTFLLQTSDLKRYLLASKRAEFVDMNAPPIYVSLEYNATDDGERYGLKAWTGKLVSRYRSEILSNW